MRSGGRSERGGPWRSVDAVEIATLDGVDRFNSRLLDLIGNMPPAEAQTRLCQG